MDAETNLQNLPQNNRKKNLVVGGIVLVLIAVAAVYYFSAKKNGDTLSTPDATVSENKSGITAQTATNSSTKTWSAGQVAVAGNFADAEAVDLGNGSYRLYYSAEPEVPGFNGQVYSATSNDGMTWTTEAGERKLMATFPDVIKLPDGKWRMYFQNAGVIKSAISTDGLNFTDEAGTRIDAKESGFTLSTVGAQSTTILPDGTYLMAYRGTINQRYQTTEKVPNSDTQLYFYATSPDGLNFTKKGVAVDSRNETLYGLTDGGEWVKWDPSTSSGQVDLRLYFWSYTGVYHTSYENGVFATPTFDYSNNTNSQIKFAPNPPGDPTFLKIGETWFMYYGQHEKGIYYSTFK